MKRKDIIVLIISSFVIGAASFLLNQSYERNGGAVTEQIATITFKKKTAQRKFFQQPVWELLYKDSPVYNKDKIRTSDDSLSIIHLDGEIELELDENTLIYLDITDGKTNINFEEGSLFARGTEGSSLNISSGDTRIDLNGANALLSREDDGSLNLNVTEGSARVSRNGNVQDVEQNQRAQISESGMSVEDYDIILERPRQNSFIVTDERITSVTFRWRSGTVSEYIFELAYDFNFNSSITRDRGSDSSKTFELEPGEYYWRVQKAGSGESSAVYKCTVLRDYPVNGGSPSRGSTFRYYQNPPSVHLGWNSSQLATSYRIEISRDADFSNTVFNAETSSSSYTVNSLEEGNYYWRVKAVYGFGGGESVLPGNASQFSVEKTDTVPQPQHAAPQEGHSVSTDFFENNSLSFNWQTNNDINAYTLQISRDRQFSSIVYSNETSSSFINLDRPLPPGDYFWRISYFDVATNSQTATEPRGFRVTGETRVQLVYPEGQAARDEEQRVHLRWSDNSQWGRYRVDVDTNRNFASPQSIETNTMHTDVRIPDENTYYWRVTRLNPDGSNRSVSTATSFTLAQQQEVSPGTFSFPAQNSSVSMDNRNSIRFTWDYDAPVILSLYKSGDTSPLFATEVTGNEYTFATLTLLDRGSYKARIAAADSGQVIAETEFILTLTPLQVPRLLTQELFLPEE